MDSKRKEIAVKIGTALAIGIFFNYCVVHNLPLLVVFIKVCVLLGMLLIMKEVWFLLWVKRKAPRELFGEVAGNFLVWVIYVISLFCYFAFLFFVVRL